MANPRFAGFYAPGAVTIVIGVPVGPAPFAQVAIPGLEGPAAFPFVLSGRASDEFFTAARNVDTVSMEVGTDGEAVANVTFDRSGTLTLVVMRSSYLNIALSLAHRALENPINPLFFTFPVEYTDPYSIGSNVVAQNCIIQRPADLSLGATQGNNTWTLLSHDTTISHGARTF